jgi:hypothetical protein
MVVGGAALEASHWSIKGEEISLTSH